MRLRDSDGAAADLDNVQMGLFVRWGTVSLVESYLRNNISFVEGERSSKRIAEALGYKNGTQFSARMGFWQLEETASHL